MIWGQAEDELFWRMMGAIQLDRRTVYVTNVIKCPQNEARNSEAMRNCLTWLEKELRLLQPQVICAMGEIAACTLTAKNAPLMRLRGTFHPCRIATDIRAQVMPTLHPRYLLGLHEPDLQKKMKAVAWQDLLLIQARLNPPH